MKEYYEDIKYKTNFIQDRVFRITQNSQQRTLVTHFLRAEKKTGQKPKQSYIAAYSTDTDAEISTQVPASLLKALYPMAAQESKTVPCRRLRNQMH